ncbi:hypothetical protein EOM86_10790 [Candidatus Nomurabacteria bacterium]|nr:hypothetical protein [Candidatus Nomurabacteria bacterium]
MAIDRDIADLGYDEILRIGFNWMNTEGRPHVEKFQHIIDRGLEILNTDEDSLDMHAVNMLVADFMNIYLKRTSNNRACHVLQA